MTTEASTESASSAELDATATSEPHLDERGLRHELRRLSPTHLALAVILVSVAVRSIWLAGFWFKDDDLVYLYRAATSGLDAGYLFERRDGHFMPGAFATVWFMQRAFGMAWWPVVVVSGALQLIGGWLTWRVLSSLMGSRYSVLPLLSIAVWSPLTLSSVLWWAAGMQFLPYFVAFPAVILLLQRHIRSGSSRDAWLPAIALAVAFLFFEKSVLIACFSAALVCAIPLTANASQSAVQRLRQAVRPLAYMVVVVTVFTVVYLLSSEDQDSTPPVTSEQVRDAGWNFVATTLLPSLLGGPWKWAFPGLAVQSGGLDPHVTPALVAAAIFVIGSMILVRRTARLWLILAGYVVADIALVSLGRVGLLGALTTTIPRYAADAVFPAVLVIGLVVLGTRHELAERRRFHTTRWRPAMPSTSLHAIGVGLSIAIAFSAIVASTRYIAALPPATAESYVAEALASIHDSDEPVEVLPQLVPCEVVNCLFAPEDRTVEMILTPSDAVFTPVEQTSRPLIALESGQLVPAQVAGVEVNPIGDDPCIVEVTPNEPSEVQLPFDLYSWWWWATIEYRAPQPSIVLVEMGGERKQVVLEATSGAMTFAIVGGGSSVKLEVLGGPLCVERLAVGNLTPVDAPVGPDQ